MNELDSFIETLSEEELAYLTTFDIKHFLENGFLLEAAPVLAQYKGKNITEKEFQKCLSFDPSSLKNYSKWIVFQFLKIEDPAIRDRFLTEDGEKLREALEIFEKLKQKKTAGVDFNIESYKTPDALYDVTDKYKEKIFAPKAEKDIIKVYSDDRWVVIIPKTIEASCKYGAETRWCTAGAKNNYFKNYSDKGPLIIIIDRDVIAQGLDESERKKRNLSIKYQFHLASDQYKDERDNEIGMEKVVKLLGAFPPEGQQKLAKLGLNVPTFQLKDLLGSRYEKKYNNVTAEDVKRLLAQGANPHINNEVVLKWAVAKNQTDIFEELLRDAATDKQEIEAMLIPALEAGSFHIIKQIVDLAGKRVITEDFFCKAIRQGDFDLVMYLINKGANLSPESAAPLATACREGKIGIVRELINRGVDINANNSYAYWSAHKAQRAKTCQLLIDNGAIIR